jgi:hypothetical protein
MIEDRAYQKCYWVPYPCIVIVLSFDGSLIQCHQFWSCFAQISCHLPQPQPNPLTHQSIYLLLDPLYLEP